MRAFERFSLLLWAMVLIVVAAQVGYVFHFWGWQPVWDVIHLLGHSAGWCGAAAMALSLLYIPRKKKWFTWGKVRTWYRIHVCLGLIGPLLIILHAYGKYHGFGGTALVCMWLVLSTGMVGHYLYRRLPEEIQVRAAVRQELLVRLDEIEAKIRDYNEATELFRSELNRAGPLSELAASPKIKLPRPTLRKDPGSVRNLWRDYLAAGHKVHELRRRVRAQGAAERRAASLKEQELVGLLDLERDTRNLVALNELFSLWRKFHVPLSWLMWWMVGLHLFGWVYY